jgi:hypothetical protein
MIGGGGSGAQLTSALVAVAGAIVVLVQVNDRLADPMAPRHAARIISGSDIGTADLANAADASDDEVAAFRTGCFSRRQMRTRVSGTSWVMNDADATAAMCDCAARKLSGTSSRLEWLMYVYGEKADSNALRSVDARIEGLGKSRTERIALTRDWRNRRAAVLRDCRS